MTDEVRDYWFAETRVVRMMSDYSSSPLWGDAGNLGTDSLGLSDGLVQRLDEWQSIFDWNLHYETGWNSEENHQRYNALGRELLPLVSAELPGYVVELHLWQGEEEIVERAGGWLPGWTPPPRDEEGTWTAYVPLNDPSE